MQFCAIFYSHKGETSVFSLKNNSSYHLFLLALFPSLKQIVSIYQHVPCHKKIVFCSCYKNYTFIVTVQIITVFHVIT